MLSLEVAENTLDGTKSTQITGVCTPVICSESGHKMALQKKVIFLLFHYKKNTIHYSYITKKQIFIKYNELLMLNTC